MKLCGSSLASGHSSRSIPTARMQQLARGNRADRGSHRALPTLRPFRISGCVLRIFFSPVSLKFRAASAALTLTLPKPPGIETGPCDPSFLEVLSFVGIDH
jgi:hypothetical protein